MDSIGITTVFGAGGIKSALFNTNKVILDGKILNLNGQQMISVVKDGERNASNYMPVRGVLEAMGYKVDWDSSRSAVVVSSNTNSNTIGFTEPVVITPTPAPTPTPQINTTLYYENFPTVPDFRWVVRDLYSISDENTLGSGQLDWLEAVYLCSDLSDTEHLFDTNVLKLLSEGFTMVTDSASISNNSYLLERSERLSSRYNNVVIKGFQKGNVIVSFCSYNETKGNRIVVYISDNTAPLPTQTPTPQTVNTYPFMNETYSFEYIVDYGNGRIGTHTVNSLVFTGYKKDKNGKIKVNYKIDGIAVLTYNEKNAVPFDSIFLSFDIDRYNSNGEKLDTVKVSLSGAGSTSIENKVVIENSVIIPADTVRMEFKSSR